MSQICNFLSAYVREETDAERTADAGTGNPEGGVEVDEVDA